MRLRFNPDVRIALKSATVIAASAFLVWLTFERVTSPRVFAADLAWTLAIAIVLGGGLALLLLSVMILRYRDARRVARAVRVSPAIEEAISSALALNSGPGLVDAKRQLGHWLEQYPSETSECFRHTLLLLKGQSSGKLIELARGIGLRQVWQKVYERGDSRKRIEIVRCLAYVSGKSGSELLAEALVDPEPDVRIEAARTLAEIGVGDDVLAVYEFSRSQSVMVKAILAEDLRSNVWLLEKEVVARDLTSGDEARVRHGLEMLKAWRTPLAVSLDRTLEHDDRGIRLAGLALLDLIHVSDTTPDLVRRNLDNESGAVVEAAALAAGKLHLTGLTPDLIRLLSSTSASVCRSAARALSVMGQHGPLEDKIRTGGAPGAEAALEAVQMAHTGRREYVRV
jgi:HEAT repeat protein